MLDEATVELAAMLTGDVWGMDDSGVAVVIEVDKGTKIPED